MRQGKQTTAGDGKTGRIPGGKEKPPYGVPHTAVSLPVRHMCVSQFRTSSFFGHTTISLLPSSILFADCTKTAYPGDRLTGDGLPPFHENRKWTVKRRSPLDFSHGCNIIGIS